jgi:hypothetical protein
MQQRLPGRLDDFAPLLDLLDAAVKAASEAARKKYRERKRRPRNGSYAALQPGPDTPLWNALAQECEKHLGRYGSKANLGRLLGVPRQRIHQLLVAKSACADAERTLQLLGWVIARRQGLTPG